ncbi:MAG TPA: carboxypeptidase-like regulatory domain-containing protein, partial [Burkholderiales bacterium]|nr:carboxypeptidase-like regulatory domain-containing protein [Burkholderiales bacterium]
MRVISILSAVLLSILPVSPAAAQTDALAGTVSSAAEGAMEGVLVSARRSDSNMTVTVVSDAQGRYRFPASRLEPGKYTLTTRAVGFDLARRATAEVTAGATA